MSLNKFHITAIAAWFVTLVVLLGARFTLGIEVTAGQILTLLVVGAVPVIVLVAVFRGAPRTIGQILYETDQTSSETNAGEKHDVR